MEAGELQVCYPNGEPIEDFAQTKAKLEQKLEQERAEKDDALAEIERLKALIEQQKRDDRIT
ncbi:MAG: hypothetical protein AAF399_14220 [Bacteroidota bacterium]